MLPASSPLKCMSPADVYLLLKSSDFVQHDLDPELVFDGCDPAHDPKAPVPYELELVLRKWYPVDRARELRCFVRQEALIGECRSSLCPNCSPLSQSWFALLRPVA